MPSSILRFCTSFVGCYALFHQLAYTLCATLSFSVCRIKWQLFQFLRELKYLSNYRHHLPSNQRVKYSPYAFAYILLNRCDVAILTPFIPLMQFMLQQTPLSHSQPSIHRCFQFNSNCHNNLRASRRLRYINTSIYSVNKQCS